MYRFSTFGKCLVLVVILAGFCVLMSSAHEDAYINEQPIPYVDMLMRRAMRMSCSQQGSTCTPDSDKCCGRMGCYSYQGGKCEYPRRSCICRNSQYYFDSNAWYKGNKSP